VLIALWLLLQGYAAVAMLFCQYSFGRLTHAENSGIPIIMTAIRIGSR
jgi:hypothetical protein